MCRMQLKQCFWLREKFTALNGYVRKEDRCTSNIVCIYINKLEKKSK